MKQDEAQIELESHLSGLKSTSLKQNVKRKRSNRFRVRHIVPEYIDDFKLSGDEMELTLVELEWVNKYLGGLQRSVWPVLKYLEKHRANVVSIVDIGCGSGDTLHTILRACKSAKHKVKLTGVDANLKVLEFARTRHFENEDLSLVYADVLNEPEKIPSAEVYTLSLFLHHFEFSDIQKLLNHLIAKQPKLIVINDLERSPLAYFLFTLLSKIRRTSHISLHDGQLSITKGFNRKEMLSMGEMGKPYHAKVSRKWAFKWQLILRKEE